MTRRPQTQLSQQKDFVDLFTAISAYVTKHAYVMKHLSLTNSDQACAQSMGAASQLPGEGNARKVKGENPKRSNFGYMARLPVCKEVTGDILDTFRHLMNMEITNIKIVFMQLFVKNL